MSSKTTIQRRTFVKAAAAAAPATAFAAGNSVLGANDRIRAAVLGVNGRGQSHMYGLAPIKNVEVATFVDPDLEIARKRAGEFEEKHGHRPSVVQDMREVFDDDSIDVVTIATPNHWHTLASIWACQAGKDVYVEKPATHTFNEGLSLIAAAKKYGRIVQHGVQLRSSEAIREAVQKMRDGAIGDVYMGRATIFKWRPPLEPAPDEAPPATLDYDLWVGPGKWRPYSKKHVHYNWHWTWDFGNGEIGNQGIHELDMLQWGLDVTLPDEIVSSGGRYLWEDHRETPEMLTTLMQFKPERKMAEVAVRFWHSNHETRSANGNIFYGSEGHLVVSGYTKWDLYRGRKPELVESGEAPTRHYENFIKAVRSRKTEDQNGPVESAHHSAALAHLGNIAFKRGKKLDFNRETNHFSGDSEANQMLSKTYRTGFEVPPPDSV
ncbi:MAG: Gfo/Idh/MocA family oxidoreductase [Bryobacterales bacterium]|nr:Gfo/Idh/MocA family oxidoreductase [Bryobacterales bacterium]